MKIHDSLQAVWIVLLLLCTGNLSAQQKISFDLAAVHNMRNSGNGFNVSSFYHFDKHLTGGIELHRIFPVHLQDPETNIQVSAWDFDLNFHYLLRLNKKCCLYPLTGISHTSEKEISHVNGKSHFERFWSINTGAGLLWEQGKWSPYVECSFNWGRLNQQFLIAGLSYELDWGHAHKAEKAGKK